MTSLDDDRSTARASRRGGASHPGPPLAAPLLAFVALFLAGALTGPVSGAGALPSPFAGGSTVPGYFAAHQDAVAVGGWLVLLSVVPLVLFAAVAYSRLTFLAPNAPGPVIVGFGGLIAAGLLALSGATTWVLGQSAVADRPALVRTLHYLNFVAGGPAHTAALGVLVIGLAVTTLFVNRTPRWLSYVGIVLAALDVLSTISLLLHAAGPLVPAGRFASLVWLVAMTLLIPRERAARRPAGSAS